MRRIGVDAMLHLLISTSLFQCVGNFCLVQLTGAPISDMKPSEPLGIQSTHDPFQNSLKRKPEEGWHQRPAKRRRLKDSTFAPIDRQPSVTVPQILAGNNESRTRRTAMDIPIPRSSMFYGRPVRLPRNRIHLGLPHRSKLFSPLTPTFLNYGF